MEWCRLQQAPPLSLLLSGRRLARVHLLAGGRPDTRGYLDTARLSLYLPERSLFSLFVLAWCSDLRCMFVSCTSLGSVLLLVLAVVVSRRSVGVQGTRFGELSLWVTGGRPPWATSRHSPPRPDLGTIRKGLACSTFVVVVVFMVFLGSVGLAYGDFMPVFLLSGFDLFRDKEEALLDTRFL